MRTTIEIDDALFRSVQKALPGLSKREVVHRALLALRHAQASATLLSLAGTEEIQDVPRR